MQHLVDVTLVINLSRDTKKLADMTGALQQQQIPFERLDAVDGSKVKRSASSCGRLCTDGMLGCFESHRKAWQTVVGRGLASALVLEDDVRLHDDATTRTRDAMRELPSHWDMLFLGCHSCGMQGPMDAVLASFLGSRSQDERVSSRLIRPGLTSGTYAYIVSNQGARRLLSLMPEPINHVDLAISSFGTQLRLFAIDPPVVTHLYDGSSIASKTPVLLNTLTDWTPPGDRRPLNWSLSEPLCQLGADDVRLNGWALLFFIAGGVCGWRHLALHPVYIYLLLDYLFLSSSWASIKGYASLAALCVLGNFAVRSCVRSEGLM